MQEMKYTVHVNTFKKKKNAFSLTFVQYDGGGNAHSNEEDQLCNANILLDM